MIKATAADVLVFGAFLNTACGIKGFLAHRHVIKTFNAYQGLGFPCVIDLKHIKTLEEAMQLGKQQRAFFLKIGLGLSSAVAITAVGIHILDWLHHRKQHAEYGQ